jgi:hypothetical protein
MRFMQIGNRYLHPNSGSGGNGSDGNNNDDQNNNDQVQGNQGFNNLLQRQNNDTQQAAWLLYQENRDYRQTNGDLRAQVQQLETRVQELTPEEGSILLTGDSAQLWTQYQALGTPGEISDQRSEFTTLQRTNMLRSAADLHGYKASVLETLVARDGLSIDVRKVDDDNGRSAFVITGEGQADIALPEYVTEHWQDFAPSLVAESRSGTKFVRQNTSGGQTAGSAVKTELNRRYALPQ